MGNLLTFYPINLKSSLMSLSVVIQTVASDKEVIWMSILYLLRNKAPLHDTANSLRYYEIQRI